MQQSRAGQQDLISTLTTASSHSILRQPQSEAQTSCFSSLAASDFACSTLRSAAVIFASKSSFICHHSTHPFTHTHLTALFPGLRRWAGTRKVKPIWILLKQETVSGSGISWTVCKSAPGSRQITTPALHHSIFYRPNALPAAQPTVSKHWRQGGTPEVGCWIMESDRIRNKGPRQAMHKLQKLWLWWWLLLSSMHV